MDILIHKILNRLSMFLGMSELRALDRSIHERFVQLGSDVTEQANHFYWGTQSRSWKQAVPPVRPSKGDLDIYQEFLKQKANAKRILILGSTPELREMAARETSATIYVADESFPMLMEMMKLAPHADHLKEKWIKDDWVTLPFPPKFFDIILGDVVLHQVTPKRERDFLQHMAYLLQNDGMFITRFFFLDQDFFNKSIDSIVKDIDVSRYSVEEKRTLIMLQVLWLYADLTERKFNRRRSAEALDHYLREGKTSNPLVENVRDILVADAYSYRDWSPSDEKNLVQMISSTFLVQDRRIAKDYPVAQYFPIVLLSRR